MATPVLSRPNAFDVAEGTVFTYNVAGVASIVRSSKVIIYDNSGELLSHLYTSTQQYHELPSKSDSSMIYASGKSADDFLNGRQYSLEFVLYSTVDGTGEPLGTSTRVSFWCFEVPTLEFIRPSAETTVTSISYKFEASIKIPYPEGGSPVQNKVQSYIFDLYKGNSTSAPMVASSGTQYGAGIATGVNEYSLSYNFGGLSDNSNYFVVLSIITEQGMTLSQSSAVITTSVEESAISIAEVENSPCEGCIYISSNISNIVGDKNAEYEEGSGHIDLTTHGQYVTWGSNGFDIIFPMITEGDGVTSKWGMIIEVKNMKYTDKNNKNHNDEYLLKLTDVDDSSCIYLFPRQQDGKTWIDLYATRMNDDTKGVAFIESNMLTGITPSTNVYVLVNCYSGLYEVRLATSL